MKIAYHLTTTDFVKFQEYIRKQKSPAYRAMVPILTLLLSINIVLFLCLNIYYSNLEYNWIFILCILLLVFMLYLNAGTKKRLSKMAEELKTKNPDLFGTTDMELNEEGIRIKTLKHEKFLKWEEVGKYENPKDLFVIFSKKGVAYVIPTRNILLDRAELKATLDKYLQ